MAMTTTVQKILEKAAEFEANARALRLAASLLNGHVREGKAAAMEATIASAAKLRKAQANGGAPSQPTDEELAERREQIRQLLLQGPRPVADLAHALNLRRDIVRYTLNHMQEVVRHGHFRDAKWALVPTVEPRRSRLSKKKRDLKPARAEKAF